MLTFFSVLVLIAAINKQAHHDAANLVEPTLVEEGVSTIKPTDQSFLLLDDAVCTDSFLTVEVSMSS